MTSHMKRSTHKSWRGHLVVPVDEAIRLYDELKTWKRVAEVLTRPDGTKFNYQGIQKAVRWRERGNAGFII